MQRETRIAHYVVGVLTALSLILLSLPLSSPVRAFKACASYIFDPISFEGEQGSQKLAEAPSRVRELLSADIENRRLQEQLRQTSWLKSTVDGLSLENDRLRKALGLKTPPGRHPVWAHVMERDPQHWYGSVGVDAGADKGVSLNDPVLGRKDDAVVAVGRVIEVRPMTSTVLLLTDQRSAAAAYLSSGTLEGLVQGQDAPHLRMNYLNSEAHLVDGDLVYTSPTSATFPPDVLIGRVAKIDPRDPFLAFQAVEVAPALDAAALQEVLILRARTLPGEGPLPPAPPLMDRGSLGPSPAVSSAPPPAAAAGAKRPRRTASGGVSFSTAAAAAAAQGAAPKAPSAPSPPPGDDESPEEAPQ
ncbi:MAG TPA: rod shape-determining protein MreC [Elusimicrobiota bacterium]|nr:rod shape-determining protein MreC [Elusimicrobiota bacterium]